MYSKNTDPNVDYGLELIIVEQYWFTSCYEHPTLKQDVPNGMLGKAGCDGRACGVSLYFLPSFSVTSNCSKKQSPLIRNNQLSAYGAVALCHQGSPPHSSKGVHGGQRLHFPITHSPPVPLCSQSLPTVAWLPALLYPCTCWPLTDIGWARGCGVSRP